MKLTSICFPIRDGKVLLSEKKRGFGEGLLNGYGGKQQEGDVTIENAVVREVKEEGGVKIAKENLEKVAIIDFYEGEEQIFECHVYFLKNWEGEFEESEEMALPQGFSMNDIPYERMWDSDRVWMPLIFAGQKIRAKSYYEPGMGKQIKFEYEELVS